jgi:hypothetical protein
MKPNPRQVISYTLYDAKRDTHDFEEDYIAGFLLNILARNLHFPKWFIRLHADRSLRTTDDDTATPAKRQTAEEAEAVEAVDSVLKHIAELNARRTTTSARAAEDKNEQLSATIRELFRIVTSRPAEFGVDVIWCEYKAPASSILWRFHPIYDTSVECILIRDIDSLLTSLDAEIVAAWLRSKHVTLCFVEYRMGQLAAGGGAAFKTSVIWKQYPHVFKMNQEKVLAAIQPSNLRYLPLPADFDEGAPILTICCVRLPTEVRVCDQEVWARDSDEAGYVKSWKQKRTWFKYQVEQTTGLYDEELKSIKPADRLEFRHIDAAPVGSTTASAGEAKEEEEEEEEDDASHCPHRAVDEQILSTWCLEFYEQKRVMVVWCRMNIDGAYFRLLLPVNVKWMQAKELLLGHISSPAAEKAGRDRNAIEWVR